MRLTELPVNYIPMLIPGAVELTCKYVLTFQFFVLAKHLLTVPCIKIVFISLCTKINYNNNNNNNIKPGPVQL